jgi:3'-phosphoadenosine 5'-phosphosulfate sulfotransferase (PAPS reductase)/FAD synthetase
MTQQVRHILSISGGKDSTALAIYMKDRQADMEYVFCDTKKELKETYEYLDKVEAYLGQPIVRLSDDRGFDHWLEVYGGYLPSPRMRWCTRQLKIRPFEKYVGEDAVISYVGIRADEDREGYISTNPNIKPRFPFKEDGITKPDVLRILEESGLGLPEYYEWRTRSGCYFCFFQRKSEWVGLKEQHPDLFDKAKAYEKFDPETGRRYTWAQSESLEELAKPERAEEIRRKHLKVLNAEQSARPDRPLSEVLADVHDLEDDEEPCLICHL